MTSVVYVRISSDRTGERAGVDRQTEDCLALCARLGLVDPLVITDNDVSAYTRRKVRPGWRRLVGMVERGEVQAIVAWHSDRLYRRSDDLNEIIRLIDAVHVDIHTVTEGDIDLSTATGRLHARVVGAVAEHESEHKSERIARRHLQIAEAGDWKGGGRTLGYESDGVTIEPVSAGVVREAAQRVLAGESSTNVARWVSGMLGRQMYPHALVRSLKSPHIAGMRIHWPQREREAWEDRRKRGEVSGDYPPHFLSLHAKRGNWPGVLDESVWRELLALFEGRQNRRRPHRSLLAGRLRCGLCGKPLGWGVDQNSKVKGGKYAVYRCSPGYGGCAKVSIAGAKIEPWLVGMVTAYAQHYSHRLSTAPEAGRDAAHQRDRLLVRLDEQASAFGDGVLTRAQFIRNKESIERELADIGTLDAAEVIRSSERRHAFDVLDDWSAVDQQRQAAAIGSFVRVVTVFPVGRGSVLAPQYRAVVTWADDEADRSLSELKDMLPSPPAPRTDAERRQLRNEHARKKRAAVRQARSASE
jgi:site-specific DNA recombinase